MKSSVYEVKNLLKSRQWDFVNFQRAMFSSPSKNGNFSKLFFEIAEFYQPGPGVILEKWVSSKQYGMDKFNDIPDFPSCPNYISHSETFEYAAVFPYMQQYGRFRTTFVPNQSGKHTFFAIVNNKAKIYIKTNPKGFQKILQHDYAVNDDWNER